MLTPPPRLRMPPPQSHRRLALRPALGACGGIRSVGAGVIRHFGQNCALKARIVTRLGASGADFGGDADLTGPELAWPSSAGPARDPSNRLRHTSLP